MSENYFNVKTYAPFDFSVWIFVVILILMFSSLTFYEYFSKKDNNNKNKNNNNNSDKWRVNISVTGFQTIVAMTLFHPRFFGISFHFFQHYFQTQNVFFIFVIHILLFFISSLSIEIYFRNKK